MAERHVSRVDSQTFHLLLTSFSKNPSYQDTIEHSEVIAFLGGPAKGKGKKVANGMFP